MDCFVKFFYQSLVLFAFCGFGLCQDETQYTLLFESIFINGSEQDYGPAYVYKYKRVDRYGFTSVQMNELCGGEFCHRNIEILEMADKEMTFSHVQLGKDELYYFKVIFESMNSLEKFFRDIRLLQKHEYEPKIEVKKLFKYPKTYRPNDVPRLTPVSCGSIFYVKNVDASRFKISKSFNFVRNVNKRTHEADLIFRPKTFNISPRLDNNKYVLCANHDQISVYVVLFPNETQASAFFASVENDVNPDIVCAANWLTPELSQQIDSPIMPALPHLPYLRARR